MLITCINNKCLYEWDYKGKSKGYICCPKCSYRFKIQRGIENKGETMLKKKETMLTYPHNIHNIEPKKKEYVKEIKKPKTEFIKEKEVKKFKNMADFNLHVLNEEMKMKNV